jgi:hypothetical protein
MDGESDAGADADLFVGNGALTLLTYESRKLPVEVDLATGVGVGGRGDDSVFDDAYGGHDVQRCGRGEDFVTSANTRDRLRGSCEDGPWATVRRADFDSTNRITVTPRVGRARVKFKSTCHSHPRCNGRIKLKRPNDGKPLGRGKFSLKGSFRDSSEANPPPNVHGVHHADAPLNRCNTAPAEA